MRVGVIGINHKSAELSLREILAEASYKSLLCGEKGDKCKSFVLLNTCNRTEVYFSSEDLTWTHSHLLQILRSNIQASFEHRLYSYFGYDCFSHLAMVTAGLDSAILAETEIQGQVKGAYEKVSQASSLPSALHFMFQKCLKIGKNVRSLFQLNRGMPTLSHAIIQVGSPLFPQLNSAKILFVGASQINIDIMKHFVAKGFENLFLCNRSLERAQNCVEGESIDIVPWEDLKRWNEYDIVILGTKARTHLITREELLKRELSRTLLIDLSVPRNVEPYLGHHPHVTLYNIDQIHSILEKTRSLKSKELLETEKYVLKSVEKQMAIFSHKDKNRQKSTITNHS